MSSAVESLNALAQPLVERAWSVAWQWTLLVLVVAFPAQWLLRNHSPALRYWVWQIVLLKLLLMPCWTYALPVAWLPAESAAPIELSPSTRPSVPPAEAVDTAGSPPEMPATEAAPVNVEPAIVSKLPAAPHLNWQAWLLVGWGALLLVQIAQLARQHRRLSQLLRAARPADERLQASVRDAASVLHLHSAPRVLVTGENVSPFACGTIRPVLVLPDGLTTSLTPAQVQQVLLHELAHVRRRDLVWGWIPQGVRMLWCFHPVVHWVAYRLRLERELACDQLAMTLSGKDAVAYAQTLVEVVTHTSQPTILGPILTAVSQPTSTISNSPPRASSPP